MFALCFRFKLPDLRSCTRCHTKMMTKLRQHRWMRVFATVVWLALLQIFVVSLLAVSPDLHEYFHPDSHDSDHHCLSTDFQAGFIEQPVIVPVVAPDFAPV